MKNLRARVCDTELKLIFLHFLFFSFLTTLFLKITLRHPSRAFRSVVAILRIVMGEGVGEREREVSSTHIKFINPFVGRVRREDDYVPALTAVATCLFAWRR